MRPYLFHIPVSKPSTAPAYRLPTLIMGVSLFFTHLGHRRTLNESHLTPPIFCASAGDTVVSLRVARIILLACSNIVALPTFSRNKDTGTLWQLLPTIEERRKRYEST